MKMPWQKTENKDKAEIVRLSKLKKVVDRIFNDTADERDEMSRYLKEYRGQWWDEKETKDSDSKVFVNYVFSTSMSIAPLLTDNRPTWAVNARKPFMQKQAELYNVCLEYLWDKLDLDRHVFRWVLTALVMKVGILQVSFDEQDGVSGEIRVDPIDPRTFFMAPGYTDLWDVPFCGTKVSRPLSWIRRFYPDKAKGVQAEQDSQGDSVERWDTAEADDWEMHSDNATVYTVWMRSDEVETQEFEDENGEKQKVETEKYPYGKILVFTKDVILEEKPSIYEHNKPPFVIFDDYLDPVSMVGMGEADQIEQLNRSYNRGLQLIDKFVTLYCDPNWLADSNAGMDVEQIKSSLPGGGNVYAYNAMVNDMPIKRLEMGELPSTVFNFLSATPKIIEEVSGVTDISKGMTTKTERQTAAEISTLIESSYTRTRQRVRNLEFSLKRLAWLFVQLMQQFYTEERSMAINRDTEVEYRRVSSSKQFMDNYMQPRPPQGKAGPEQQVQYEQEQEDYEKYKQFVSEFGPTDPVYVDFDVTVESNSTLPMDKQSLANLFLRLVQLKVIDPQALLEQLKVPRYKEIIKRMQQQAQMQMQMQQKQQGGRPGPRMPGQGGKAPTDLADLLNTNSRPEGV